MEMNEWPLEFRNANINRRSIALEYNTVWSALYCSEKGIELLQVPGKGSFTGKWYYIFTDVSLSIFILKYTSVLKSLAK